MTQLIIHPRSFLVHLDSSIERRLGLDLRLLYGFALPVLGMAGLIALMMLSRNIWAMGAAVLVEIVLVVLVVTGFMNVLDDEREPE